MIAPVTHDEAWTVDSYIDLPLSRILDPSLGPNHHFFNTLVVKLFNQLGDSLFILRFPSMLASIGFLTGLFLLARRMEAYLGIPFFIAAAFHPYLLDLSIMARGYSYGLCFIYLSLALLLRSSSATHSRTRFSSVIIGILIGCASLSIASFIYPALAIILAYLIQTLDSSGSKQPSVRPARVSSLVYLAGPALLIMSLYYSGALLFLSELLETKHAPTLWFFTILRMYSVSIEPWAKSLEIHDALALFSDTMFLGRYYSRNLDTTTNIVTAIFTGSFLIGLIRSFVSKSVTRRSLYDFGFLSLMGLVATNLLLQTCYPLPRHFCWLVPIFYLSIFDNAFYMLGKVGGGRWSHGIVSLILSAGLIISAAANFNPKEITGFRSDLAFPELFDRLADDAAGSRAVLFEPNGSWYFFLHRYYERTGRVSSIDWTTELEEATHFIAGEIDARADSLSSHEPIFSNRDKSVILYRINPEAPFPELGK